MSRKKKLPAYGRDLMEYRQLGKAPVSVWVICGNDWSRLPEGFVLCVKPDQDPFEMNWSVVAGIACKVVQREGDVVPVAAAIAEHSPKVDVYWKAGDDDWPDPEGATCVADLEFLMPMTRSFQNGSPIWPEYWSDEKQQAYVTNKNRWYRWIYKKYTGNELH